MSKLKIKNQFLPERCEICHQKDFFDPGLNYCSRCSPVSKNNQITNQKSQNSQNNQIANQYGNNPAFETIAETITDICPTNITVMVSNDWCGLTYKWFTSYSLIIAVASILFISLPVATFFDKSPETNTKTETLYNEPMVFVIVIILVLWVIYFAIGSCINKTTIKATASEIIISQSPLPWLHSHRFSINEISHVYVDEKLDKNSYAWYRVKVSLKNSRSYTITPYMFNSETAFFISDQLYRWVRIIRVTA